MLTACQRPDPSSSGEWIRLPAVAGRPGAAYFTIKGGTEDTALVGVSTPIAQRAELHETMTMGSGTMGAGGMSGMRALARVPVPAADLVDFVPGGRHVMLFGVSPSARPGTSVPLTLRFANGHLVQTSARVLGAGDPPP